ncbi:flavin-containing monooxygenase [Herbidospora yilanensis]|uniref:flavin-containing monooxygenase n=1 Tax=Herbidospora yilanensis TaxID=354426 RepID=UPI0007840D75|nr:NAD(P)/FAD-dependent oxidoreductase [Herbidospora yilanensis]
MRVAIVGAGFGGLCMAVRLARKGIPHVVFEKGDGVGGTWRDNTYPGAGCDIPSHLYSYSFDPYCDWSRRYPGQPEILAYLEMIAARYGVRPRFRTEVTELAHDGAGWLVVTPGSAERFDVVVTAVGQLNRPRVPVIPGAGTFAGDAFHSARWAGRDLAGRRVAVIGTGSSAAQLIPPVAATAEHLDVYQRTPNWVLPKADAEFAPLTRAVFRWVPGAHRAYRRWFFDYVEKTVWPALVGGWSTDLIRRTALAHLRRQVPDPELRRRLTPAYPPGCRRVVFDSHFYPALTRPNVDLVTEPIVRIVPEGVETPSGLRRADTIVYATGFRSTEFLLPMAVTNADGRDLHDQWKDGAEAYLGMAAPGFPNLFFLYGPNTNLGHNSIVYMLEAQVGYVLGCLDLIARRGRMEVTEEALAAYTTALNRALAATVWNGDCRSWYKTPGGRITTNWPRTAREYRRITRRPRPGAYKFGAGR